MDSILIDLKYVGDSTRQDCTKLILRIKRKGAVVVSQGAATQQALLLNLFNDLAMLTDTVDTAPAADDTERQLLEEIGKKITKKVGPRVWGMLSKLGKV